MINVNFGRLSRWAFLVVLLFSLGLWGCGEGEATATPTDRPRPVVAATDEPPTSTNTPEPSPTAEPTLTPTPADTDTPVPEPTETETPRPEVSDTPEPEADPTEFMALIPGGTYTMGVMIDVLVEECNVFGRLCPPNLFEAAEPPHLVNLPSFYLDLYEVNNEAFIAFLNEQGNHEGTCFAQDCLNFEENRIVLDDDGSYKVADTFLDHPVNGVTWFGAAAFCQWRGARLPTEAEWEMAASWDPETETKTLYPWGDVFEGSIVNFCDVNCDESQANEDFDDGYAQTAPIGSYEDGQSQTGVYDLAGNLWEWVLDWFAPDYYSESPLENPRGPEEGEMRVVRGGSWFDTGNFTNIAFRTGIDPALSDDSIGFRCALDGE